MDRDLMMKQLLATFLEELAENVVALNRDLLGLEKADSPGDRAESLKVLFRTAHSLKGAARSANVGPIERACHALESLLARAQTNATVLTGEVFAVLFAAADGLEEAGMRLREQQELSDSPLVRLLPRLEAVANETAVPTAPPVRPSPPSASPTPERGEGRVESGEQRQPYLLSPLSTVDSPLPLEPPADGHSAPVPQPGSRSAEHESLVPLADVGGSVRVPAEKLDTFLARTGALLVVRRRVQARVDDLTVLRAQVGRWKTEWQETARSLPGLLGRKQATASRSGAENGTPVPNWPPQLVKAVTEVGARIGQLEKGMERLGVALVADVSGLEEVGGALDDEVRRVRMLPFAAACEGLARMVRDLAQAAGKEVDLVLEGGEIEMDRSVLEGLRDPLRHLVRNAIDHGAEPPQERQAAAKPPQMRLTIAALLRGAQVEVVVSDDGQGLDLDALRRQLRKRGLPEPADDRELARAVFLPGVSTSRIITDLSVRGIGLDVVKSRVEALHGTIDLSFVRGRGTRFSLAVPLTLTTLRALLVTAGGQTFAFADTNVQRLLRINPADLRSVEGREMLAVGGPPVPVASLADTLGLPRREGPQGSKLPVVLIAAGDKRMAFVVQELLSEQEVVVKGLGARIRRLRHVSGATLLPSGGIALVLNAANLVRTALAQRPATTVAPLAGVAPTTRRRLLVVDDSVTTRTLEKSILEAAGYDVAVASDGAVAWHLLQERGFDLIVSDVDMPRMDGFALTEAVRGSRSFQNLPVVLVTARATEEDQARGLAVGANAYLLKSSFDQTNLLETIGQLL